MVVKGRGSGRCQEDGEGRETSLIVSMSLVHVQASTVLDFRYSDNGAAMAYDMRAGRTHRGL